MAAKTREEALEALVDCLDTALLCTNGGTPVPLHLIHRIHTLRQQIHTKENTQ